MINKKLIEFCNRFSINLLNTSRRCAKLRNITSTSFTTADNDLTFKIENDTEPLLTVEIPLSKLEFISNIESQFFNNIDDIYGRHIFHRWMSDQSDEKALRREYETLQAAYDQYQLTLSLVRQNPKQFKDL